MPKIKFTNGKGLVTSAGSGATFTVGDAGFTLDVLPKSTVSAKSAATTFIQPGAYTLSSSAVLTGTMPLASSVPGGIFVFRAGSAHAHVLTASAEDNGTLAFVHGGLNMTGSHGSKLALTAAVGNSVSLLSDGLSFCVLTQSGTLTIDGT